MSDIGSGGVFLNTQDPLPMGKRVDLLLDWPAVLDGGAVRLVIRGRVLRNSAGGSAVRILKYEYKLRSTNGKRLAMAE